MRLPPFLQFLEPKFSRIRRVRTKNDGLSFRGDLRVERYDPSGKVDVICDDKNFIVDAGLTAIRDVLVGPNGGGFTGSIFRIAIGDGGVPAGELFNPKSADATWPARTGLFHEMIRQDISVFETPTTSSMRFVGSFNSQDITSSSYQLSDRVVNEAALIIGDGVLTVGGDKKRIQDGDVVDSDETMISMRTFKSASFDNAENITVQISWTITVSKQ